MISYVHRQIKIQSIWNISYWAKAVKLALPTRNVKISNVWMNIEFGWSECCKRWWFNVIWKRRLRHEGNKVKPSRSVFIFVCKLSGSLLFSSMCHQINLIIYRRVFLLISTDKRAKRHNVICRLFSHDLFAHHCEYGRKFVSTLINVAKLLGSFNCWIISTKSLYYVALESCHQADRLNFCFADINKKNLFQVTSCIIAVNSWKVC